MSSLAPLLSLALLLPAGALLVSAPAARSAGAAAGQRSGSRPLMQTVEEAASAAQPVLWSPDKVADIRIEGGKTLKTFKMPARALAANGARLVLLHTSGPREVACGRRTRSACSTCSSLPTVGRSRPRWSCGSDPTGERFPTHGRRGGSAQRRQRAHFASCTIAICGGAPHGT